MQARYDEGVPRRTPEMAEKPSVTFLPELDDAKGQQKNSKDDDMNMLEETKPPLPEGMPSKFEYEVLPARVEVGSSSLTSFGNFSGRIPGSSSWAGWAKKYNKTFLTTKKLGRRSRA